VRAYSAHHRAALERAFREREGRSGIDLGALPLTDLADIDDPTSVVLRPEYTTMSRYGSPALYGKVLWARATGRVGSLNRTLIDPTYKPIHWTSEDGFLVGASSVDLDRLAELGRRWLELAGVLPGDVVVSVVHPGPRLAFWELALGTRRAGLTTMLLPSGAPGFEVAGLGPTVLAGASDDLSRIIDAAHPDALSGVRIVLVVGEPPDPDRRAAIHDALGRDDVVVLYAWAPAGVRALWAECAGRNGLHTWPDAEVVEVVDGEIVWTALGWYGTVLVRLRTGVVGGIATGPCPSCGRTTPRILVGEVESAPARRPVPDVEIEAPVPERSEERPVQAPPPRRKPRVPPFVRVLDQHSGVLDWQAELRVVGGEEELLVFLATTAGNGNLPAVLQDLVHAMHVTQFVVLDADTLAARIEAFDGERIVDLRP
jgi:hypothetical protein